MAWIIEPIWRLSLLYLWLLKRHQWTPAKMLQLAMNSKARNPLHAATIAAFMLGFHSKNRVPPAKNGSATATITITPERLAHLYVEQDLLYPWMCFTSWFELHRSQGEGFSAPSSVKFYSVTFLLCQTVRGGSVMIAVAL